MSSEKTILVGVCFQLPVTKGRAEPTTIRASINHGTTGPAYCRTSVTKWSRGMEDLPSMVTGTKNTTRPISDSTISLAASFHTPGVPTGTMAAVCVSARVLSVITEPLRTHQQLSIQRYTSHRLLC
ncbi:hypothetical protein AB0Y14_06585 [Rothia sp. HC945]|uniref:hypothetical protein n=1 Tax=Rothia sp. HC945 TaxID=3171170 RepID=UPI003F220C16